MLGPRHLHFDRCTQCPFFGEPEGVIYLQYHGAHTLSWSWVDIEEVPSLGVLDNNMPPQIFHFNHRTERQSIEDFSNSINGEKAELLLCDFCY